MLIKSTNYAIGLHLMKEMDGLLILILNQEFSQDHLNQVLVRNYSLLKQRIMDYSVHYQINQYTELYWKSLHAIDREETLLMVLRSKLVFLI